MKKLSATIALVFISTLWCATPAMAKYASYSAASAYLSWGAANSIYTSLNATTTGQDTPHGGYLTTTVKCAICHSTHRAASDISSLGLGSDLNLASTNSCASCHSATGANATSSLIEFGTKTTGPHMTNDTGCNGAGCHGSVHASVTQSKYAMVRKYNLANQGSVGALDTLIDKAIASGNVPLDTSGNEIMTTRSTDGTSVKAISEKSLDQGMKAYVTGYVCYPCHGQASRSVANARFASPNGYKGHLSIGTSITTYIPTCEGCHDMVGVATNTTAFPHANRGIDVYVGRFNQATQNISVSTTTRPTTNTDDTRYGLWMTSANYNDNTNAEPVVGVIANAKSDWVVSAPATSSVAQQNIDAMLVDGFCIKCHQPSTLR